MGFGNFSRTTLAAYWTKWADCLEILLQRFPITGWNMLFNLIAASAKRRRGPRKLGLCRPPPTSRRAPDAGNMGGNTMHLRKLNVQLSKCLSGTSLELDLVLSLWVNPGCNRLEGRTLRRGLQLVLPRKSITTYQ